MTGGWSEQGEKCMTLLSIQEEAENASGWDAVVRIDNGPKDRVTISNPFSARLCTIWGKNQT